MLHNKAISFLRLHKEHLLVVFLVTIIPAILILLSLGSRFIAKASWGGWGNDGYISACVGTRGGLSLTESGACKTNETQAFWIKDVDAGTGLTATRDSNGLKLSLTNNDGWISADDTWTYASATSFTISGADRTSIYTKGTRVKATNNGSTFYGVVASSSFSTNTTVTLVGNSDYSLNDSAITNTRYSYAASPQGYPTWFTYDPSPSGVTDVSWGRKRFSVFGSQITVELQFGGASNSTSLSAWAPIAKDSDGTFAYPAIIQNAGAYKSSVALLGISHNSKFDFGTDANYAGGANLNNFTSSGGKGAQFEVTYTF